jgi:hypothetical protein
MRYAVSIGVESRDTQVLVHAGRLGGLRAEASEWNGQWVEIAAQCSERRIDGKLQESGLGIPPAGSAEE